MWTVASELQAEVLADLLDGRRVALALDVAADEVEDLLLPSGQVHADLRRRSLGESVAGRQPAVSASCRPTPRWFGFATGMGRGGSLAGGAGAAGHAGRRPVSWPLRGRPGGCGSKPGPTTPGPPTPYPPTPYHAHAVSP